MNRAENSDVLIKFANILKESTIKECPEKDIDPDRPKSEQRWCLYSKDGDELLGRHSTKEDALDQEQAIHINKGSFVNYIFDTLVRIAQSLDDSGETNSADMVDDLIRKVSKFLCINL